MTPEMNGRKFAAYREKLGRGLTAMDGLLKEVADTADDNFYELLGCDERSTVSMELRCRLR